MRRLRPILALDPGLKHLGYAVLQRRRVLAFGVVALAELPNPVRHRVARRQVLELIERYGARDLVIEKTYRHPVPWLDGLDRLTRSLRRYCGRHGMRFATYAPQAVRLGVVGYGRATKRTVAEYLSSKYPGLRIHLTSDRKWKDRYWQNAYDALATGLYHRQQQPPSRSR